MSSALVRWLACILQFVMYERKVVSFFINVDTFPLLQANRMRAVEMRNRCTVALDGANYSKNRYTDVLPCKLIRYIGIKFHVCSPNVFSSFRNVSL